jgi:uncharacterized protein (TIGR04255 family)
VPNKVLSDLGTALTPVFAQRGFYPAPSVPNQLAINLEFGPAGLVQKAMTQLAFSTPDGASSLTISPQVLVWQTNAYVRWTPFIGQFEEIAGPIVSRISELSPVSMTKLDYVDRFYWSGEWDDIDYSQLIRSDTTLLSARVMQADREWHSHIGWFVFMNDRRRLFNVNIDVVDAPRLERLAPSVGILTMAQDQPLPGREPIDWPDLQSIVSNFDANHVEVKKLLASLVVPSIADRISLNQPS